MTNITVKELTLLLGISASSFKSRVKTEQIYIDHCPKVIDYRRKAALYDLDAAIAFKEILYKTAEAPTRKKSTVPSLIEYSGHQVLAINFLRSCRHSHGSF